jgi:hypothetical protein
VREPGRYLTLKERIADLLGLQAWLLTGFEQGVIHACSLTPDERRAYIARLHAERFDYNGRAR